MGQFRQFALKKFGIEELNFPVKAYDAEVYQSFVKVFFIRRGGHIAIDFKEYRLEQDALFFVSSDQWYNLQSAVTQSLLMYYNRDFYCVEIHDKEVLCDGFLFHNAYDVPVVYLDAAQSLEIQRILNEIRSELSGEDDAMEEMIRALLKQIIIKATRIWKQSNYAEAENNEEMEFARRFSQLVEWNYTTKHAVADYAALLNITPKTLGKKLARHSSVTPNDIIKNRIILEAKRLLAHTDLSVKEIGYKLGYEDPAYFIRIFTWHVQLAPQQFRKSYHNAERQG
ncbi:MAG: AraC family transcriptional regulator [Flavitalea sp.]